MILRVVQRRTEQNRRSIQPSLVQESTFRCPVTASVGNSTSPHDGFVLHCTKTNPNVCRFTEHNEDKSRESNSTEGRDAAMVSTIRTRLNVVGYSMSDDQLTNNDAHATSQAVEGNSNTPPPGSSGKGPLIKWLVAGFVLVPLLGLLGHRIWTVVEAQTDAEHRSSLGSGSDTADGSQTRNGFDVTTALIPRERIFAGGPPRDGIPALKNPQYVALSEANYLDDDEEVIGIEIAGDARAYPLRLMDDHEAVNDTVGKTPVAVTYCPLCRSAAVFDRRVDGETIEFGISGLLYNSNVLLFDRHESKPESLWSQMMGESVTVSESPRQLTMLPVELTTWGDWKSRFPQGRVLITENKDQREGPYDRYYESLFTIAFPISKRNGRLPPKEPVLGVRTANASRAYPLLVFENLQEPTDFQQTIDGLQLTLRYDPQSRSLRITQHDDGVEWMYCYWFAWYVFNQDTEIHNPASTDGGNDNSPADG